MGQFILGLARGVDSAAVLQSEEFIAAKKKWSGGTESKIPSVRREALEASNRVQVQRCLGGSGCVQIAWLVEQAQLGPAPLQLGFTCALTCRKRLFRATRQ